MEYEESPEILEALIEWLLESHTNGDVYARIE